MAMRLLGWINRQNLAEVSRYQHLHSTGGAGAAALVVDVAGEGNFLHSPVHARFFKGFESGSLGMGETGLGAAFGEGPAAAAGSYEQEFQLCAANPETNRGYLFRCSQFA